MIRERAKKSAKISKLQILNGIMVLISCILCIVLIYVTTQISRQYQIMVSATDAYISCEKGAALISEGSDWLTEQVQNFTMHMEPQYVDAYFLEVNDTQRRETALIQLSSYVDTEVCKSIQGALDRSNQLMETEIYAMRLIVEAQGYDLTSFPQELQNIQLSKEDLDLKPDEQIEKARSLVFGSDYQFAKRSITEDITLFVDSVMESTLQNQQDSVSALWRIMLKQVVLLILLLIQSLVTFILIILRSLKKQKEDKIFINQVIRSFATSIDMKDKYTNGHSFRVAQYSGMIARKSGFSKAEVNKIYNIGLLHDIGKIIVPDEILNKPHRLSDEEFSIMKEHAINGSKILQAIEIAPDLALGAAYHHERIDGRGYPDGRKGDEIPEIAQIIAVADTFDAMYSTRPYRKQMSIDDVVEELKRSSGTQLSPKYVDALLELISEGMLDTV